jgi:hypothetical protein
MACLLGGRLCLAVALPGAYVPPARRCRCFAGAFRSDRLSARRWRGAVPSEAVTPRSWQSRPGTASSSLLPLLRRSLCTDRSTLPFFAGALRSDRLSARRWRGAVPSEAVTPRSWQSRPGTASSSLLPLVRRCRWFAVASVAVAFWAGAFAWYFLLRRHIYCSPRVTPASDAVSLGFLSYFCRLSRSTFRQIWAYY